MDRDGAALKQRSEQQQADTQQPLVGSLLKDDEHLALVIAGLARASQHQGSLVRWSSVNSTGSPLSVGTSGSGSSALALTAARASAQRSPALASFSISPLGASLPSAAAALLSRRVPTAKVAAPATPLVSIEVPDINPPPMKLPQLLGSAPAVGEPSQRGPGRLQELKAPSCAALLYALSAPSAGGGLAAALPPLRSLRLSAAERSSAERPLSMPEVRSLVLALTEAVDAGAWVSVFPKTLGNAIKKDFAEGTLHD